jgi:hypothetical protein
VTWRASAHLSGNDVDRGSRAINSIAARRIRSPHW